MVVSLDDFLWAVSLLSERSFDVVVIGSSVPALFLKEGDLGSDIDFYAISPDPLIDEESFFSLADDLGWLTGRTWADTPSLITDRDFSLDFYTSIFEFEIPSSFIKNTRRWKIRGVSFKTVGLEEALLLKARAALVNSDHEKELMKLSRKLVGRLDKDKLYGMTSEFDESVRNVIIRVLSKAGF